MINAPVALARPELLRAKGVGICMDDFGMGATPSPSCNLPHRHPEDRLSPSSPLFHTVEGAEIVRTILNLGEALPRKSSPRASTVPRWTCRWAMGYP